MALQDKYINPFTDFGFKKLFGSEPNKDLLFQKLFGAAEIAKFTPDEKTKYEESLKYYRDLKNVVDTSFDEGKAEGKDERNLEIGRQMKAKGMKINLIAKITGLSIDEIENI